MSGGFSPLVAGAIVLTVAGMMLVNHGHGLDRDALHGVEEGSFHAVSRTRGVDQMAAEGRVDGELVRSWVREATGADEREVLERLLSCEPGAPCDDAFRAAREHYAAALEDAWASSAEAADQGRTFLTAGVASFIAAIVLAIVAVGRASRVSRVSPPADDESLEANPAVEALLRKRLEDLYAARLRAWESDRFAAYGELAAGLSHGLKTPLASIRAATQVAIRRLGADHPATSQLYDVIAEVDGLVEQVKRFLAATGSGEPVPARVAPGHLVEAIETGYASEAETRGVTLDCAVADDLGEVLVDAALLEMALRNLVENALAVAPDGSEVRVSAGWTEPPSRVGLDDVAPAKGRWCEIVVADEGPGIPAEVLGKGPVESKKPDGSGLGLAIARRITARHGGALIVDTGPDQGTSVRVVLPAAPEEGTGVAT
jgi:signal transduction histidine kinase